MQLKKLSDELESERNRCNAKQKRIKSLESSVQYYKKECHELREELLKKRFDAEHLNVTTEK